MNQVLIECNELIDEYKLNKETIETQLASMKMEDHAENFVVGYAADSKFILLGKVMEGNQVVLTHIEKAIAFEKMDNSDLFQM